MASFESVVDEYDAGRPEHPSGVYDTLGPLEGLRVLDVGAGTGIATRSLLARGASVVAIDPGAAVLGRAVGRTPSLAALVADGARLPIRSRAVDVLCFAQSWHWLDTATRCAEAHRVLDHGGRWAGWWSHARADDEPWFDAYWSAIEVACPGTHRGQRDTDWGASVAGSGHFEVGERMVIPWVREITVDLWLTDQASHSYVAGLAAQRRDELLARLRSIVDQRFPTGEMQVPYETWLWIATRV